MMLFLPESWFFKPLAPFQGERTVSKLDQSQIGLDLTGGPLIDKGPFNGPGDRASQGFSKHHATGFSNGGHRLLGPFTNARAPHFGEEERVR